MKTWGAPQAFPTLAHAMPTKKPDRQNGKKSPRQTWDVIVAPEKENFLIELPFDPQEVFGQARPPIVVTVNDYSFRWTVAVYGGKSFIGIRRSHREAAKLKPGQKVTISVVRDDKPRVVSPPDDLALALKKDQTARAAWDALSFTHQKEHVDALADAKRPETRVRRLASTLAMLLAKPKPKPKAKAKAKATPKAKRATRA
jgi:hypothetical protein